jgi:excisionase family DNA binding protein
MTTETTTTQHRITTFEELEHLPLLLTVSEAVQVSGLSEAHVRRQLRTGAIRGSKIGEAWRINRDEFLAMCGLATEG